MLENLEQKLAAAEALQVGGGTEKWNNSANSYEAIIAEYGPTPAVLNGLGVPLRMLNRHPEAIATFTYARALALQTKDLEQAVLADAGLIDAWRTANRCPDFLYPSYVMPENRRAYLHTIAASFIPETDVLMAYISGPSLPKVEAFTQRGLLANDMGNLQDALESYNVAISRARVLVKSDPNNAKFQNRLARTLTVMGVSLQTVENLDEALKCQKESYSIYRQWSPDLRGVGNSGTGVADIFVAKGDYDAARQLYKELLSETEKDPETHQMIAERLAKLPTS